MAEIIRCAQCGGQNPTDARFCIDCGGSLSPPAATGPTVRLNGPICTNCRTANPDHAHFCVVCGRHLHTAAGAQARPPARQRPAQQSFPRVAAPPQPIPATPPAQQQQQRQNNFPIATVILLAGLLALIASQSLWPGILWVIGLSLTASALFAGRSERAIQALIWWGGLAFLFSFGIFWPGILVLVLIQTIFNKQHRSKRRTCGW